MPRENSKKNPRTAEELSALKIDPEQVMDKVVGYLLDINHPQGGSKAKYFTEMMGYSNKNAVDLANQSVFNGNNAEFVGHNGYGAQYNLTVRIDSADGTKKHQINTGWIHVDGEDTIRLVTAYPNSR